MKGSVHLRPIRPDDEEFLFRVYAGTRQHELAVVDWDEEHKEAFLRQQFHAQHTFYQQQFADAQFDIILKGEEPIGRLYVDRRDDEIRIIDIALLPEHRGYGIGTQLMNDLLAEGAEAGNPVRIHVEKFNQGATRLYERLGFQVVEDKPVHLLMEWTSEAEVRSC